MLDKIRSFYNRYSIPKENRYASYAASMSKMSTIFRAMFIFCVFEIVMTFASDKMEQEMGGNIRIYYLLFGIFMLFGVIITSYWKKNHGKNIEQDMRIAKTTLISTALFFCGLTVYEALTFDNMHNVIAICVIIAIAVLFLVEVNPILYSGIIFLIITVNIPKLYALYDNVSMIVNSYLFLIVISYASYSFMTKELKRLNYEKELREYTESIEDKVEEETEKRTKLQDDIIYSMADLVENRDMDTGEHIKRTALFVEIIAKKARELGYYQDEITDEFIEYLKKAMPLHDIGKIVIPDDILKAPRKLTKEEFEVMKTHALKGSEIIENIFTNIEEADYISYASNIAKFHHEWWNGNGYPYKRVEEEIPLVARIAAIADVFDALISSRCYKDAYGVDEAFEIMASENGTHFDPKLFEAFMNSKDEIIKVVEDMAE